MRNFKSILLAILMLSLSACLEGSGSGGSSGGGVGKSGSMARFAISGDYLYTINKEQIMAFDITRPEEPLLYTQSSVGNDIETLFIYKDKLYIGSQGGVYIYDKATPNSNINKVGEFTHVRSCDPVVVADDLAFVTLQSGSSCRVNSVENSLQVLDVQDPFNPVLSKDSQGFENTRRLIEPKGLGIDNNILFICDGAGGLKVFNVDKTTDEQGGAVTVDLTFNRDATRSEINCYDLIPYNNTLIVSNGEDVRQFDYSQLPMVELGRIK